MRNHPRTCFRAQRRVAALAAVLRISSLSTPRQKDDSESRVKMLLQAVAQQPGDDATMATNTSQSPSELSTDSPMAIDPVISPQREPPVRLMDPSCRRDWFTNHLQGWRLLPPGRVRAGARPGACLFSGEKQRFLRANHTLFQQWQNQVMPLENIAQEVFDAIYHQRQTEWAWNMLL